VPVANVTCSRNARRKSPPLLKGRRVHSRESGSSSPFRVAQTADHERNIVFGDSVRATRTCEPPPPGRRGSPVMAAFTSLGRSPCPGALACFPPSASSSAAPPPVPHRQIRHPEPTTRSRRCRRLRLPSAPGCRLYRPCRRLRPPPEPCPVLRPKATARPRLFPRPVAVPVCQRPTNVRRPPLPPLQAAPPLVPRPSPHRDQIPAASAPRPPRDSAARISCRNFVGSSIVRRTCLPLAPSTFDVNWRRNGYSRHRTVCRHESIH